jgi:GDP-4-dehydro-6-deoxy-D-mannose reductase
MILVTGINGFVGRHLARELSKRKIKVVGVGNSEKHANTEIADIVEAYYQCDVSNPEAVKQLKLSEIDAVINLAGLANVGASFAQPDLYMKVNVDVLTVLGKALFAANPEARMIAVSTGALYDPNQPMPLNEESKTLKSGSPYAQSKLAMEDAALEFRNDGFDCIVVRPFNHIGPGQGSGFLIPDMVQKLRTTDSTRPTITAGNLKTVRDYTDVRDIVKAYADLASAPKLGHDLYNVCSGRGSSGEDIVRELCLALDIDFKKLEIEVDKSLIRPTDPQKIIGDNSRLQNETGWCPELDLRATISAIISQS